MSDYNTLQRRRNLIVGSFVMVAACAFVWMVVIFGELPAFAQKWNSYELAVKFPSAPGVLQQTPVKYCGYQIGKVTSVEPPKFDEETRAAYITIKMAISDEFRDKIPSNVDFKVMTRSIGSSYIELKVDPDLPPVTTYLFELSPGLEGTIGISNDFIPEDLQDELKGFVGKLTTLMGSLDSLLGEGQGQIDVAQVIEDTHMMIKNADQAFISVQKFSETGSENLQDTAEKLGDALVGIEKVMTKINSGDGTVGRLVNDGLLYENLLDSSQQLQIALEQLKIAVAEMRENGIKIKL